MLKIAVGTTSKWKIGALNEVLDEIKVKAELLPFEVETSVLSQPRNEKETKIGSINRAREALLLADNAEIGLGIEFGYEPVGPTYIMHAWATIIDKDENIYSEQSSTLELPKFFYQYLQDNDEVGYHVGEFKDQRSDEAWTYFSEVIQYRLPFIKESARNVLLRYYYRKEY